MNKRQTGMEYEQRAAQLLAERGYRIMERNFRCRQGEIDLIAEDGEYLVFVEVKYRQDGQMGRSTEAVNFRKQQRIIRSARYYLLCHPDERERPCRFDVVAFQGEEAELFQDAFWCG